MRFQQEYAGKIKKLIVFFSPFVLIFLLANSLYYILAFEPLIEIRRMKFAFEDLNKRFQTVFELISERNYFITHMLVPSESGEYRLLPLEKLQPYLKEELILEIHSARKKKENNAITPYEIFSLYSRAIGTVLSETSLYHKYRVESVEFYRFLLAKLIFLLVIENTYKEKWSYLLYNSHTTSGEQKKKLLQIHLESIAFQNIYTTGMLNISPEKVKQSAFLLHVPDEIQELRNSVFTARIHLPAPHFKKIYGLYENRIRNLQTFYEQHNSILLSFLKEKESRVDTNFVFITFLGSIVFFIFLWSYRGVKKYYNELENIVFIDPLTELYNIRFLWNRLSKELKNNNTPLSFIIIDLDNFKSINDTFGHDVGDTVIKQFAQILKKQAKQIFVRCDVIRYGGDEFILLVTGYSKEETLKLVKLLKENLTGQGISLSKGMAIKVQFSVGVAHYPDDVKDASSLFQTADSLLFLAKQSGKNSVLHL